jgi:hypothetical protein
MDLRDRVNASSVFHAARESPVFAGIFRETDYRVDYLILIIFNVKGIVVGWSFAGTGKSKSPLMNTDIGSDEGERRGKD